MKHHDINSTESRKDEIKLRKSSEAREQSLVYRWSTKQSVRQAAPGIEWLFHVPNGEKRDAITGNRLKAMGVKPGVPDLMLPVAMAGFHGLVIEMKKTGEGKTTDEQNKWLTHFVSQDWMVAVCYSAREAHAVLCDYFGIDPLQHPF